MIKRDIVISVILTILTCGLYGIIWFMTITDDTIALSSSNRLPSGLTCFLLTILTCGIYGIYWSYTIGQLLKEASEEENLPAADNSIVYLILCILKLDLINFILMQENINRLIDYA